MKIRLGNGILSITLSKCICGYKEPKEEKVNSRMFRKWLKLTTYDKDQYQNRRLGTVKELREYSKQGRHPAGLSAVVRKLDTYFNYVPPYN